MFPSFLHDSTLQCRFYNIRKDIQFQSTESMRITQSVTSIEYSRLIQQSLNDWRNHLNMIMKLTWSKVFLLLCELFRWEAWRDPCRSCSFCFARKWPDVLDPFQYRYDGPVAVPAHPPTTCQWKKVVSNITINWTECDFIFQFYWSIFNIHC